MQKKLPKNLMAFLVNLMTELEPQMNSEYDSGDNLMASMEDRIGDKNFRGLTSLGNGHFRKVYRYKYGGTDVVIKLQYRKYKKDDYCFRMGNSIELDVWQTVKERQPELLKFLAPVVEDYSFFHPCILIQEYVELDMDKYPSWVVRDQIEMKLSDMFKEIKIKVDDIRVGNTLFDEANPVIIDYGCFSIHPIDADLDHL